MQTRRQSRITRRTKSLTMTTAMKKNMTPDEVYKAVWQQFKLHTLRSSSVNGPVVTNPGQAAIIAASMAKKVASAYGIKQYQLEF